MVGAKRIGIIITVAVLVALGVASCAMDRVMLDATYARYTPPASSILTTYEDYDGVYPREDVEFELDGCTLRGHVYGPQNTRGFIVFRHGIFSQHEDYLPLITALVDRGWRVFAYDAIGCGESDGDSTLGMSQSPRDVAAAVAFVQETGLDDGMKIALVGHSWGGYGVAAALARVDGISACVTMSGYDTPMKIITFSAQDAMGPLAITQAPTLWLNTVIDFGADADRSASEAIRNSGVPTLVIHGMSDRTVPFDDVSIADSLPDATGNAPSAATIVTLAEEGRSGHNTYFYSRESQLLFDGYYEALQQVIDENGGNASAPAAIAYRDSIDIVAANTADPALIDQIDSFLGANLQA